MAHGIPGRLSKHRQFDPETGKHVPGRCRLGADSGLRKLMRAARRGTVPSEMLRVIADAQREATRRADSGYAHG